MLLVIRMNNSTERTLVYMYFGEDKQVRKYIRWILARVLPACQLAVYPAYNITPKHKREDSADAVQRNSTKRWDRKKAERKRAGEISTLACKAQFSAGCWSVWLERETVIYESADTQCVLPIIDLLWLSHVSATCENRDTEAGRDVLTGIWGDRKQFNSATECAEKPQSVRESFINWSPFGKWSLIKCGILGETSNMLNHPKWPRLLELWPSGLCCKDFRAWLCTFMQWSALLTQQKGSISESFFFFTDN